MKHLIFALLLLPAFLAAQTRLMSAAESAKGVMFGGTAPTMGQVLQFDGSNYAPATIAGGGRARVSKAADQIIASTSGEDVSDLVTATLTSGNTYEIEVVIYHTVSLAANGIGFGWVFSGTGTVIGSFVQPNGSTGAVSISGTGTTFMGATQTSGSPTSGCVIAKITVTPSTSGTLQIRMASEATLFATAKAGSRLFVETF